MAVHTLKNAATGLYVNPNGTGAQLRGGTAPSPWGGSAWTWKDHAHLPGQDRARKQT